MEMPELNEDLLTETNPEMLNQAEDSESLDESALQTDSQISTNIDPTQEKMEDVEPEEKSQENLDESEDTLDDMDLPKPDEESLEPVPQRGSSLPEIEEEKSIDEDEPARKKPKVDEQEDTFTPEQATNIDQQENAAPQSELEPESESQSQPEVESEMQPEGNEAQELMDIDKSIEDTSKVATDNKEEEKGTAGPDTDMLATLASAALEQDPKDKNDKSGAATSNTTTAAITTITTPKSPVIKTETETHKKKSEMWCNVGVFDTNTTIVSDYLATPETSEHVDLVTATLGGRRIQLEPGTAYKFRVCAVNGCGTGPWSDVAAFKTTLPGFPGAPSAIKISKSPEGAHLTWEPPGGNSSEILEYAVYLAVRSASQGCQPVTTNQAQLAFVRVFCGPTNKCMVGTNSLQAAHIDTTTKPAIIFRIAARNSKGYGPATQVRWLQESQNGTSQGVKRTVKT